MNSRRWKENRWRKNAHTHTQATENQNCIQQYFQLIHIPSSASTLVSIWLTPESEKCTHWQYRCVCVCVFFISFCRFALSMHLKRFIYSQNRRITQHLMQRFSIEWVAPILTGGNITCDVIDCTGYSPTIKRLQFDYIWFERILCASVCFGNVIVCRWNA